MTRAAQHDRSSPAPAASRALLSGLLRTLRPEQWVKNFFVFAALLFGQRLGDPTAVARTVGAFIAFCALSGTVYLINDLRDLERDRRHPVKRLRPLAAGDLSPLAAWMAAVVLGSGALLGARWLPREFLWFAAAYLVLNLVYSFGLKNIVILDVLAIAGGFVLRAVAGAAAIPVQFSQWLVLCTFLLALFLGFGKRRHELTLLADDAAEHRVSLQEYSIVFLDQMITVVLAATVVAYSFYTMSTEVAARLHTTALPLTIPFVLYGIFRYLYLIHHRRGGGSPAHALLHDGALLVDVALWAVSVGVILSLR
ncbi:MAG: decaprenyl-phosphate phosphoribosyltransferase [Acidobacteriota bacterium]